MRLADAASLLGLVPVRDAEFQRLGFAHESKPGTLAPLFDPRFVERVSRPEIVAVIASEELAPLVPQRLGVLLAPDPQDVLYRLHLHLMERGGFYPDFGPSVVDKTANVHPSTVIAERGVEIGPNCHIGPHVVLHEGVALGSRVVVRSGVIIGDQGFEVRSVGGQWMTVPHAGGVNIGNGVEIQANSTVDRGLFGDTEIGERTKIDNLVYIAHGARLGARCRVGAGAVINGSTFIGDDTWIGPNATVSSSLRVGNRARISLGAVVTQDVPEDGHVSGNFAIDHRAFIEHLKEIR